MEEREKLIVSKTAKFSNAIKVAEEGVESAGQS
jgi:hypothetical protein